MIFWLHRLFLESQRQSANLIAAPFSALASSLCAIRHARTSECQLLKACSSRLESVPAWEIIVHKSWLGPAVLLSLVALVGCGGGGSNVPGPQPPSSTSVAAATPVFSPPSGTYSSAQTVTISDSTPGATIYYTTD